MTSFRATITSPNASLSRFKCSSERICSPCDFSMLTCSPYFIIPNFCGLVAWRGDSGSHQLQHHDALHQRGGEPEDPDEPATRAEQDHPIRGLPCVQGVRGQPQQARGRRRDPRRQSRPPHRLPAQVQVRQRYDISNITAFGSRSPFPSSDSSRCIRLQLNLHLLTDSEQFIEEKNILISTLEHMEVPAALAAAASSSSSAAKS